MHALDDHSRVQLLRVTAVLGMCLSVAIAAAQTSDRVVWNASGAAGLRIVPKPLDDGATPGVVPSAAVDPLQTGERWPNAPSASASAPHGWAQPNATATLIDPPRPPDAARQLTFAPNGLLWEPPLGGKREPRLAGLPNGLSDQFTQDTVDTQIGGTVGVVRFQPGGTDLEMQVDLFGVVNSRFADYDVFVVSDYRAGVPITFRRGPWHAKIAYEHTSTHLGDELIENLGARRIEFIKDEFVIGFGGTFDDRLRLYGQIGYAFRQFVTGNPKKYRYDVGFEWFHRAPTGPSGTPYISGNLGFRGENNYSADFTLQAGWIWRMADQRVTQWRVFGEFYQGRSFYGQLYRNPESFVSFGLSVDY